MPEVSNYKKLTEQEIEQQVTRLQGWKFVNGKLNRSFEFDNFTQAYGFMVKVAM